MAKIPDDIKAGMKQLSEVTKIPTKDLLAQLKEFINKKANNTTITRKELHRYVYSDPDIARYMLNNSMTVDTYRTNLTHIGILQKTHKRGKYTKKRNIPPKLSTTALKNLASTVISGTWKSWFISIPDELKKYE